MGRPRKIVDVDSNTTMEAADITKEVGIVGNFTKREAVALRVLLAFVAGKAGQVQADQVRDVVAIADAFSEAMGWE